MVGRAKPGHDGGAKLLPTRDAMAIRLRPLDDASADAWDAFVAAMPNGSFFHRATWARVIETAFGHRCHYTLAEQDGAIVGVLPLTHVRTRLFGNTLVSTPFCVYGGPLAAEPEALDALEAHAEALRIRLGASAVELRERRGRRGRLAGPSGPLRHIPQTDHWR